MGSIFINAGLAAGVALAAVPLILHLFMKQTPKHVIFPALRLIKERQKRSRKKLRVKNWLLLLARMGLLALMALALARPRIDATAALGTGDEPAAMALVFDTSLSMGYLEADTPRLAEAKARAYDVLKKVNDQSKVFIVDSADPGPPVASSPAAARKKIDTLAIRPVNRTLNGAMGAAYTAVASIDLPRREVYVFTDLAASQWQTGQEVEGLAQAMKTIKKGTINTFVLRVGAKEVRDVAIVSAETLAPIVTQDEPIAVKVKLRNVGPKTRRTVELRVDGETAPYDPKSVEVPANGEIDVPPLVTPKFPVGLHQIEVRIKGDPDPMEFDDVHYLTVEVQPAIKMLLISDREIDSQFVALALDPSAQSEGLARTFQVERVLTSQLDAKLTGKPLKSYAGIFLLNVKQLDSTWWNRLSVYVREGGGLVVAPAGLANLDNYNTGAAAELLPTSLVKIRSHLNLDPPLAFAKPDLNSPLFASNQKELMAELAVAPIYKTWEVPADNKKAQVLLRYTDDTPALLERTFPGQRPGKVMLWTTPLSRRPQINDPEAWNDFPVAGWGFLVVMLQTAYYVSGASGQKLSYESGEDAVLALDPNRQFSAFAVKGPKAKSNDRGGESLGAGLLLVASPGEIGQWTVEASSKDGQPPQKLGFSVNPPRTETQTSLLATRDLDTLFGKGKYQLAADAKTLKIAVGKMTVGREIFPWIMVVILVLITLENLLANTFYREKTAATAIPRAA